VEEIARKAVVIKEIPPGYCLNLKVKPKLGSEHIKESGK
jgi:hypothetical protein